MSAQGSINAITGALSGAAIAATKIAEGLDKESTKDIKPEQEKNSGKDMKMAAKARKSYQQKINAIYANKELSNKARTRRIGKLLDEYQEGGK